MVWDRSMNCNSLTLFYNKTSLTWHWRQSTQNNFDIWSLSTIIFWHSGKILTGILLIYVQFLHCLFLMWGTKPCYPKVPFFLYFGLRGFSETWTDIKKWVLLTLLKIMVNLIWHHDCFLPFDICSFDTRATSRWHLSFGQENKVNLPIYSPSPPPL